MLGSPGAVRRMIGWLGALAWILVGVPIAIQHGSLDAPLICWASAFLGFGVAMVASARGRRSWMTRIGWPAVQVICAVAMVLALCDGLEVLLLSLVAFQLGEWAPPRLGVAWVIVQTIASSAAMAVHWSLGAALMLGPPYFGFQLLAYTSAYLIERVAEGRADRARLAERMRMSRELHDIAGHRLTALSLQLQVLQRTAPAELRERVDAAHALVDDVLAEVRASVAAGRDPGGAGPALRALGDRIPRPRVHVRVPDDLAIDDPQLANAVIRCVEEIVTNAARHADADNLWIDVGATGDGVSVRARDDGRGTEQIVEGNGLRGMRERLAELGGDVQISSRAGSGTTVDARIPLRPTAHEPAA